MEVIRRRESRLRSAAGAVVMALLVAGAITGGYFGLRHTAAPGDGAAGPAPRSGAAMAYDPATGDVVMFGGAGASDQVLDDTWLWNGSSWSQARPSQSPPARSGALMAWDPQSQRVIMLGGMGGSGCAPGIGDVRDSSAAGGICIVQEDAWAWDGTDWTQINLGSAAGDLGTYSLAGAEMATEPATGQIVLLTTSAGWTPQSGSAGGTASSGSSGSGASSGSSGVSSGSVNPGGMCIGVGGGPCSVASSSPVPVPPASPITLPAQTACSMVGGCGCFGGPIAQGSDGSTGSGATSNIACPVPCSAATSDIACPVPCAATCMICPATSGTTGNEPSTPVTCGNCGVLAPCPLLPATLTWVFDGSAFHQADSTPDGTPALSGDLVWYPGPSILADLSWEVEPAMGGPAINCPAGAPCAPLVPETAWEWTGSAWKSVTTSGTTPFFAVPPVADLQTGDAVGLDESGDTWVSTDPTSGWTKASPATAPTSRSGTALAYDSATGEVVLFGGEILGSTSTAGQVAGDTWTWDGSDWTLRAGSPPASATPAPSGTPVILPATAPAVPPTVTGPTSATATATSTATATATPVSTATATPASTPTATPTSTATATATSAATATAANTATTR